MKKKSILLLASFIVAMIALSSCRTGRSAPHCPAYRAQIEMNHQINR